MKNIFNPMEGIDMIPYETPLVKFVDHIIEERIKMGRPTVITNENHWGLVDFIIKGWATLYPEYARPFFNHMKTVRANATKNGVSREGEAMLQHQLEIPESVFKMLSIAFPMQKWDKKFVLKFAGRYKGFMGANSI